MAEEVEKRRRGGRKTIECQNTDWKNEVEESKKGVETVKNDISENKKNIFFKSETTETYMLKNVKLSLIRIFKKYFEKYFEILCCLIDIF